MTEDDVEHLLDKLRYRDLLQLAKDSSIEPKGKKKQVIRAILKAVDSNKIRDYFGKMQEIKADINKHELVPEHEIMKKDEVQNVLDEFHCKIQNLPRILDTDSMVLKIGAKTGDVIRIKRHSPTSGHSYYYRVVVRNF